MKRLYLLFIASLLCTQAAAQNINFAKKNIDTLASPAMHGRGYVNNGINLAANYIKKELKALNLSPLGQDFFQPFHLPINTFPDTVTFSVDNKNLKAGEEYLIAANSPSLSGTFPVQVLPGKISRDSILLRSFCKEDHTDKFLIIDRLAATKKQKKLLDSITANNVCTAKGYINLREKIHWHVSKAHSVKGHVTIDVLKKSWPSSAKNIELTINTRFNSKFPVNNVVGYVPGKKYWSNFIVITAHYDHLGRMGNSVYFPGANDNGSGTAMALDLARHYAQPANKPDYSTVFIFFAAEEAGLLGSKYFTEHPLVPLARIRFLINLDMIGTGGDGITVVNGKVVDEFKKLTAINDTAEYLPEIKARGKAANSDHYHFSEKSVPAVFIYSRGDNYREYHNIQDKAKGLPLTGYNGIFKLLTGFIDQL